MTSPSASEVGTSWYSIGKAEFAGFAVEYEHVPRFSGLRHSVHQRAAAVHRDEAGGSRKVAIPEVVLDRLKVPDALPGGSL